MKLRHLRALFTNLIFVFDLLLGREKGQQHCQREGRVEEGGGAGTVGCASHVSAKWKAKWQPMSAADYL